MTSARYWGAGLLSAGCVAAVGSAACARPCANGLRDGDRVTVRLADRWREGEGYDWTRVAPPAGDPCGGVDALGPGFTFELDILDADIYVARDRSYEDCRLASASLASDVGLALRPIVAGAPVGNAVVAAADAECTAVVCHAQWAIGLWVGAPDDLFQPLVDGGPAYVAVTRQYYRFVGSDVVTCSDTWAAEVRRVE